VKVLTGRVVPHYFAGFGGGRKALLPGVASYETIVANHRLTLAAERGVAPGVAPCVLDGNPVHLDMIEASRFVRPTFALSTVLDAQDRLVGVFAGETESSHRQACSFARRIHQVCVDEPFDAVITSAGGAPYDMNFMQSLKALFNTQEAVRPGGAMLWIAECLLGVAPFFLDWASFEDDETLEREVRRSYNLGGHNSIMLRHLTRRCEVGMVTAMPADRARRLGLHPLGSLEAGLRWLGERVRPGAHVAFVPFGNITHLGLATSGGST
jgi:nickel-dependent lactate racemase